MGNQKRRLIPDQEIIVVLDTGPVRSIAHQEAEPDWVATFDKMADDGYSFSLADHAWAELVDQYHRGSFDRAGLDKILKAISQFLNSEVPILPGKRGLLAMVGESQDATWSEDVERMLSADKWQVLNDPTALTDDQISEIRAELQRERDEWIGWFKTIDDIYAKLLERNPEMEDEEPLNEFKHTALDACFSKMADYSRCREPDLSTRVDLQIRYVWRQWVRSRSTKDPYDPSSPKKINDGIDLDMYKYLMLPAFGVADDSGFHGSLKDIGSRQRTWFWRAQQLADAWTNGERPQPNWE